MAETTIHGIEFQIKGNSKNAADAISKLAENLKTLKQATSGGLGLGETVSQLKKLADSVSKIDSTAVKNMKGLSSGLEKLSKVRLNPADISNLSKSVKRLGPVLEVFQKFGEIGKIGVIGSVAKQLTELQTVINGMSEDSVKRLDEITKALERLKGIDFRGFTKAAKAAAKEVQTGLATISPKSEAMSAVQENATDKEIADIFKAYGTGGQTATVENATKKFVVSPLGALKIDLRECVKLLGQAAIKMIPFREQIAGAAIEAGKMVKEFANDPIGNTMKGLGSIIYAPFKSNIKNAKEYASKLGNVLHQFKRVAGYRLIRTVLKEIVQGFQEGTKNLYEWSTLTGGTFAKNMDDAATSMLYFKNSIGAAWSPLMNVLAPALRAVTDAAVDLLNIINQLLARLTGQTSWTRAKRVATEYGDAVAGAGQAAKEAMRYLAPFDELNVLPDNKDRGGGGGAANNMSEMFEEVATFDEGIADFADKVRTAIQNSDWQGLGTLLGEKVNEIVDSLDWSAGGTKVGKGINAWFTTKYWTLETINFQNIGSKIAEFLNSALENINFNTIGRTLTQGFTNFGDFVIGAIENIDWGLVGSSIKDMITGAFDQMSEWAQSVDWSEFGTNLYNDLKSFIEGLDFATIASSLFTLLGSAIGAAASMLSSFISGAVDDIWNYFMSFAQDANGDGEIAGKEIFNAILKGIKNAVTGIWTWIKTNVWEPFVSGFKKAAGVDSEDGEGAGLGKTLGTKILEGLASPFIKIKEWVQEHIIEPIKNALSGFSISKLLFGDDESVDDSGASGETNIDIKATLTKVGDWSQDVVDVVKEKGGEVKKTVKAIVDKAQGWVKEAGDALLSPDSTTKTVLTAVDKAKSWLKEAADIVLSPNAITKTVSTAVDKAKSWVKEAADVVLAPNAVTKTVSTALDKAKTWVADAWTAITQPKEKSTKVTASVKKGTWVKDAWAATKLKASSITKKVTSTVNKGKTFVQDAFTAAKMKASSIIRSVASAVSKGSWDGEAYKVSVLTSGKATRDVTANAKKGSINANAYNVLTARGGYVDVFANITSLTNGLGYDPSLSASAYFDSYLDGFGNNRPSVDGTLTVTNVTLDDNAWAQYEYLTRKEGGVLSGGVWRSIPQYASGTSRAHGSLFVAGEAGPEIVGHIGGRTEVLNRSQLAATMYSAVSRAIMGVRFNINAINAPSTTSDSYDEEAMYRAMLRALNDSDAFPDEIDLDGDVVYRKMVKRNQMNTRMTGRNAMATA